MADMLSVDAEAMGLEEAMADDAAMSPEEFEGAVKAAISDAVDYIDSFVARDRERAERFYRGEPFGNEEEGRSAVVLTEVRDTILAMMPSLLRVFTGTSKAVEFAPRRAEDEAMAEQATDYVNFVFREDNPGYMIMFSAIKDALKSKVGILKWGTAPKNVISEEAFDNMDEAQLNLLMQDPTVKVLRAVQTGEGDINPMTGAPSPVFSVLIRRNSEELRQFVECIPPEEFIIARNARDLDSADYVGHRSMKTLSELVAMGYTREEIEENGSTASSFELNLEAQVRNPALNNFLGSGADNSDPSMRRYEYIESYIRIDKDGDGIAELRRVCTIGESSYVLFDEVVEDVKFAVICPDPEPHMVIGSSIADQVMDLQLIKSNIVRNMLDSLAQSIFPRTAYVEGAVNADDLMNVEVGGLVRMTQPGMIQELGTTFVGQQAMGVLAYLDDIRASRTGMSKASQGLDPDVLQSTTKAAVMATMTASQERLEMIARTFAETGIRRLFRGLLKEIIRHQDKPRVIRLRNQWVEVDPRAWDADMDVVVNVGLGFGTDEQKLQGLMAILAQQKEIIQTMGPNNPVVTPKMMRNTIAQIIELQGFRDAARYFAEITPEVEQQLAQPPQPQPDPTQILAQVEAQKVQKDIEIADKKMAADIEAQNKKMAVDIATQKAADDRERDKVEAELWLKAYEMSLKYGVRVPVEEAIALLNRNRDAEAPMGMQ